MDSKARDKIVTWICGCTIGMVHFGTTPVGPNGEGRLWTLGLLAIASTTATIIAWDCRNAIYRRLAYAFVYVMTVVVFSLGSRIFEMSATELVQSTAFIASYAAICSGMAIFVGWCAGRTEIRAGTMNVEDVQQP